METFMSSSGYVSRNTDSYTAFDSSGRWPSVYFTLLWVTATIIQLHYINIMTRQKSAA